MTASPTTTTYEMRRVAALSIAVAALEQANAAEEDDPISAHQFRLVLETSRRIVARMNRVIGDLEQGRVEQ